MKASREAESDMRSIAQLLAKALTAAFAGVRVLVITKVRLEASARALAWDQPNDPELIAHCAPESVSRPETRFVTEDPSVIVDCGEETP